MTEIEAKFLLRRAADVAIALDTIAAAGAAITPRGTATHTDTYFDTPDWAVFRAGWVCRCREQAGARTLMLKSFGTEEDTVFTREEVTQPLPAGVAPERGALPPGPVQARLGDIAGRRRRNALFTVQTERSVYALELPVGAAFELHVDRTTVSGRKRAASAPGALSFVELEIELDRGRVQDLRGLSRRLARLPGVIPARCSKFDRGLRAIGATPGGDEDAAATPRFRAGDAFLDLVFAYLAQRLESLARNVDAAREGIDPEGVHKMRVSIRRIRAILAAFPAVFTGRRYADLDRELRWLGRQLGEARDADVSAGNAAARIAALPADAALAAAPYAAYMRARTDEACGRLVRALGSRRFERLDTELRRIIGAGPDRGQRRRAGGITVADASRRYVRPAVRSFLQRGERVGPQAPAARLHKLRIQAKRLRYALDLMSSAQPRRWQATILALEKLQDLLGAHQDACTARDRLREFLACPAGARADRDTLLAIGRLMQLEDERMARARLRLPRAWSRFRRSVT